VFQFEDSGSLFGPPAPCPKNQARELKLLVGARTTPNHPHSTLYVAPPAIRAPRARKAAQGAWEKNHPSSCWKKLPLAQNIL